MTYKKLKIDQCQSSLPIILDKFEQMTKEQKRKRWLKIVNLTIRKFRKMTLKNTLKTKSMITIVEKKFLEIS